jgi:hypothetical protein
MRRWNSVAGLAILGLVTVATSVASVSYLLAANAGWGRQGQAAGGSFVRAVVDGIVFDHVLTNGELAQNAAIALAAQIDAHADYSATPGIVPSGVFEPDDILIEVLKQPGSLEVTSVSACENDANYTNSGVHIAAGLPQAVVLKPTAVAGGGTFNLRLDMVTAPNVNETINTSAGNVSGLIAAIQTALQNLGFSVDSRGPYLTIGKAGDSIVSIRVESTDSLIKHTCVGLETASPVQAVQMPLLGPFTVMLLSAGLLLAGILAIRRWVAAA